MIVTPPLAMVEQTMKAQGIPEVPEGFLHDHSWIQGANEQIGGGGGKQDHALLVAR